MLVAPTRQDWAALGRSPAEALLPPGWDHSSGARRPLIARFDVIAPQAIVRRAARADVVEAPPTA